MKTCMVMNLKDLLDMATTEARHRGFRGAGIYHLLWAVHKNEPAVFQRWIEAYRVDEISFIKMLENVLRPRRAGGGIPRDRLDGELLEDALARATRLAGETDGHPDAEHLGRILQELQEDPIASLCERFTLTFEPP